jgi:hypothetical protein
MYIFLFLAVIKESEHLMLLICDVPIVYEYRQALNWACHVLQIPSYPDTLRQNIDVLGLAYGIRMTVLEPVLPDPLQPGACFQIRPIQNAEHLVLPILLHSCVQGGCLRIDVVLGLSGGEGAPESRL